MNTRKHSGLLLCTLLLWAGAFAPQMRSQSSDGSGPNLIKRLRARGIPRSNKLQSQEAPRVVTSFSWDWNGLAQYLESIAIDREGNIYASVTDFWLDNSGRPAVGHVYKVITDGEKERVATLPAGPWAMGLAFDEEGRLYVGSDADVGDGIPGAVYRIEQDGSATLVLTLPSGSAPNGLAFYRGDLYVADYLLGAIWKKGPDLLEDPPVLWFQDPLISHGSGPNDWCGANGIAFYHDDLYIGVTDAGPWNGLDSSGRIVRVPIKRDGWPGHPKVLAQESQLAGVDGIAFDIYGTLWVAIAYTNGLGTVAPNGKFSLVEDNPGWLDYPTQPAFGTTLKTRTTLFLSNGGINVGSPNIISFKVGVPGMPLPAE